MLARSECEIRRSHNHSSMLTRQMVSKCVESVTKQFMVPCSRLCRLAVPGDGVTRKESRLVDERDIRSMHYSENSAANRP